LHQTPFLSFQSLIVYNKNLPWQNTGKKKSLHAKRNKKQPGDKWYSEAIAWAAPNGIVEGYGNGREQPVPSLRQ